ncbi:molybdopterin-dependent oxidoreductase [Halomonas sp. BM-2019]|uniref:molybdopterin-dependent oxidoreductase n=1 Tax=Halomonas sp. BM-2019 TaxID=2811227 RepID=UPI001B3C2DAE|nr:MAG: molybdopterin-dependent oxidoreductase [Halomonas sp. BM-2019]
MRQHLPLLFVLLLLPPLTPLMASQTPLSAPSGEVLLTISGEIQRPNVGDEARFDRPMLMAIAPTVIETRTPWHPDRGRFEGPLLREVLATAGVRSDRVRVRALNGFEAEIPLSDLLEYDVILAMTRNDSPIPIRYFGPLFVLYPFDEHPELLTEAVRFRSVWQVTEIHAP